MTRKRAGPLPASDDTSVPHPASDPTTEWQAAFGSPAPERLVAVMTLGLAWQRQVAEHGDVPRGIREDLRLIARDVREGRQMRGGGTDDTATGGTTVPHVVDDADAGVDAMVGSRTRRAPPATVRAPLSAPLPPASSALVVGTRLVKLHGGTTHVVEVTATGLVYNGQVYASLSAIAKAITGTHWNGLLFFGLRRRKTYPAKVAGRG